MDFLHKFYNFLHKCQPSIYTNSESCSEPFLVPTNENEVNESLEFLHYELELQSRDREDIETGKTLIISLSVI